MFNKLDLYNYKVDLFKNRYPEEFLLFVWNFNTNLTASGTLETDAKVQYLCTIVHGEGLLQFEPLSADVEGTNT